jgi:hypothetical protein
MATPAPSDHARVWRAEPHDAAAVAALLMAFRDHLGFDEPSDEAFTASVERLIGDPATEYLLGASSAGTPPMGVAQLRYRGRSGATPRTASSRTCSSRPTRAAAGSAARCSCGCGCDHSSPGSSEYMTQS